MLKSRRSNLRKYCSFNNNSWKQMEKVFYLEKKKKNSQCIKICFQKSLQLSTENWVTAHARDFCWAQWIPVHYVRPSVRASITVQATLLSKLRRSRRALKRFLNWQRCCTLVSTNIIPYVKVVEKTHLNCARIFFWNYFK